MNDCKLLLQVGSRSPEDSACKFVSTALAHLLLLSVIAAGCSSPPPPPPPPEPVAEAPQFLDHTVKFPGETLGVIAKWYTGKTMNWNLIVEANPGMNPNRISLGDVIKIPQEIVIEEKPLARSSVRRSVPAVASKTEEAEEANVEPLTETEVDQVAESLKPQAIGEEDKALVDELLNELSEEPAEKVEANKEPVVAEPVKDEPSSASLEAPKMDDNKTTPAVEQAASAGDDAAKKGAADDTERERLLDELLNQ